MADKDDDVDVEEEVEGEDEDENSSKDSGSKKKLIIIIASILLLVLIVAGGLYFAGFFEADQGKEESNVIGETLDEENPDKVVDEEQSLKKTSVEKTNSDEGEKTKKPLITKGQFYHKFEDLNVNLVSSKRKPKYLRLSITVAVTREDDVVVIEKLSPRVIDNVIQYLSGLKPNEMAGTANFVKVQDNILLRVRTAVAPIIVTDALITLALVK